MRRQRLKESNKELNNPGCGWYHIYTFRIPLLQGEGACREKALDFCDCNPQERLALVLIDISAYRARELTEDALSYVSEIFDFFHSVQKQMILRFVYDTQGKAAEREPASIGLVKRHMEQAGRVISRYAEDILVLQGVFVGNWGEMHGSKFLGDRDLAELIHVLYAVTEGSCSLAVRTPVQFRRIIGDQRTNPALKSGLALFNDGIWGSETDLGTYGENRKPKAGQNSPWSRRQELAWQKRHVEFAPNGGEALCGEAPVGYEQAVSDLKKMHLSYLNSVYHPEILDYWKKEKVKGTGVWKGISGFDYIGRHLGYRFIVRQVRVLPGRRLSVKVENCGFGTLYEDAECLLLVKQKNGNEICISLAADPRRWRSGESVWIKAALPGEDEVPGEYEFFLQLKRKRDGRILFFANEGFGEKVLLGRISANGRK